MMTVRNRRKMAGIPRGVISRLPVYYRYLSGLSQAHEKISSAELGKALNMTAAQIRSDLSYFGSFGLHGYGYRSTRASSFTTPGIRCLTIGRAQLPEFPAEGFVISAIFDSDPQIIGEELGGVKIRSIDGLEKYLKSNPCDIAVICTPRDVSQGICDRLVAAGVKAIWNFSPIHLQVPDDVVVEHIHLTDSLLHLSFHLRHRTESNQS